MSDSEIRTKTLEFHPAERDAGKVFARSGIEHLRAMAAGEVADPPISSHVGLRVVRVEPGDVVMTAEPDESHHNPSGSVHGGFFATVLDSVCGCAVHSTLPAGDREPIGRGGPGLAVHVRFTSARVRASGVSGCCRLVASVAAPATIEAGERIGECRVVQAARSPRRSPGDAKDVGERECAGVAVSQVAARVE